MRAEDLVNYHLARIEKGEIKTKWDLHALVKDLVERVRSEKIDFDQMGRVMDAFSNKGRLEKEEKPN